VGKEIFNTLALSLLSNASNKLPYRGIKRVSYSSSIILITVVTALISAQVIRSIEVMMAVFTCLVSTIRTLQLPNACKY
jgi:hypothetical protein